MKISVSPLPSASAMDSTEKPAKKPMSPAEEKLFLMYQIGQSAAKADPKGMSLVSHLMLHPGDKKAIDALRKHFGIKTDAQIKREQERALKRIRDSEIHAKMIGDVYHSMSEIGYRPVHDYARTGLVPHGGCRFTPDCGRGKDLMFNSWNEAVDWLKSADAWKPRKY